MKSKETGNVKNIVRMEVSSREVDGRKYVSVNNNHHGNIWINIFLRCLEHIESLYFRKGIIKSIKMAGGTN